MFGAAGAGVIGPLIVVSYTIIVGIFSVFLMYFQSKKHRDISNVRFKTYTVNCSLMTAILFASAFVALIASNEVVWAISFLGSMIVFLLVALLSKNYVRLFCNSKLILIPSIIVCAVFQIPTIALVSVLIIKWLNT
ncbi:hypothetical protein Kalk_20675 [Ketobacter alkanivorans]|uniref:Uncharacterized protein n=1 Tax=Ketobacter alkanivorans TaxID=1917421 RepID=A0A2K9LT93_9GAMM|nr:hypothetical protein Kalk_20675 [Ketobacter alkanivorans]